MTKTLNSGEFDESRSDCACSIREPHRHIADDYGNEVVVFLLPTFTDDFGYSFG